MLDQDADKAFKRSKQGSVQHDRANTCAGFVDVGDIKTFWQIQINLQGTTLPVTTDGIAQHKFQLRPVKCAFAGIHYIRDAHVAKR